MAGYTIKYGDTLANIASANGTTAAALAKMNNISDPNKITAGTTINLADSTPPPPVAPTSTVVPGQQTPEQRAAAFRDSGVSPTSIPTTPQQGPMTSSDLARGTSLPDPSTLASTQNKGDLSSMVSNVAGTTLDATGKAIDALLAKQQADTAAAKAAEQAKVTATEGKISTLAANSATADQDALAATREKFKVDETISSLQSINSKIVAAQEALNMGLIYEQDRPAREQLILGRSASLQKQGLATIGALQATAQVLQGNVDLAESYAKTTMDAINTDNKNALDSLTLLLDLHNNNLITLTADEKATVNTRITALQDQDKQIQQNQSDVFDLIKNYPGAAQAGGVTLLDDRATALKKMLPKMSSDEQLKFNADLAATNRGNAGTTDKDGPAADKQQLLGLKANGMTYQEALNAFSDTLSVDWINSVYREPDPKASSGQQGVTDNYYNQFLDENGKIKSGYTVTIDPKTGRPIVNQDPTDSKAWWEFWK